MICKAMTNRNKVLFQKNTYFFNFNNTFQRKIKLNKAKYKIFLIVMNKKFLVSFSFWKIERQESLFFFRRSRRRRWWPWKNPVYLLLATVFDRDSYKDILNRYLKIQLSFMGLGGVKLPRKISAKRQGSEKIYREEPSIFNK